MSSELENQKALKRRYEKCFIQKYGRFLLKIFNNKEVSEKMEYMEPGLPKIMEGEAKTVNKRKPVVAEKIPKIDFLTPLKPLSLQSSILEDLENTPINMECKFEESIAKTKMLVEKEPENNSKNINQEMPILTLKESNSLIEENIEKIKKLLYTSHVVKKIKQATKEEYIENVPDLPAKLPYIEEEVVRSTNNSLRGQIDIEGYECYIDLEDFL